MISSKDTVKEAILKAKAKKVYIEGNFVKLFSDTSDPVVKEYIEECKRKDISSRKKRLQITKQVQKQNKELEEAAVIKEALVIELQNRSEEHTSELQSRLHLVCRLLLEKKNRIRDKHSI